ncbi:MAG: condensation domain-containing protein, partial [Candidatus Acidiferrales bacterium]
MRRHEVTRAIIKEEDGHPIQQILPPQPLDLPVVDLRSIPEEHRHSEAMRLAACEARKSFDLAKGPTWRFTLFLLAEDNYCLLTTNHHIASDGWSCGVFLKELGIIYEAFRNGEQSPLPEPAIQYADYAAWQAEWLQSSAARKQLAYWKQQLSGALPVLELPADRGRPLIRTFNGARCSFSIPGSLSSALKNLSKQQGATLYMLLLATFHTLLSRYTGIDECIIGTPIANRSYSEIEGLLGYFVNTLALRIKSSGDMTFSELLKEVRRRTLGAFLNKDMPIENLVDALRPERTQTYSPLFQVLFVFQNTPIAAVELPGLSISAVEIDSGTSKFDLTLSLFETDAGITGWFEYATDLFDADRMERMVRHFEVMLEGIVANPSQRLNELPLLTEQERRQLLVDWNDTKVDYPGNTCLHQLIEDQVERTPDSVAVEFDGKRLSYSELNGRANQVAHHLIRLGVGPDVPVGLFVERSPEMLIGILGILKAGAAYVPMDPEYPKVRVRYILDDSKAAIVLTQKSVSGDLPSFAGQSIRLDADWARIAAESNENPAVNVRPEQLAYVLFTSGSTGRPKGVALEHRNAVTFIQWAKQVFTPQELACVLFSTSVCFDLSVFEVFVTLSAGGKLIIAPSALYLPSLPARDEVTLINTVPSVMAELVRMGGVPSSIKTANLAGEALSEALVEQIYATTNVERVYNLY